MAIEFWSAVFHAAPPRAPIARARGLAAFRRVRAKFKAGDLNSSMSWLTKFFRRRFVGSGVLGMSMPKVGWRRIRHESIDLGGDHDAEYYVMQHKRSGLVVTFLVVNCMSVSTGKLHAKSIMRGAIEIGAHIIMATECRDFRSYFVDVGRFYEWDQPGQLGSEASGSCIGVSKHNLKITKKERIVGSEATREGGGIGQRTIVRDRIRVGTKR